VARRVAIASVQPSRLFGGASRGEKPPVRGLEGIVSGGETKQPKRQYIGTGADNRRSLLGDLSVGKKKGRGRGLESLLLKGGDLGSKSEPSRE